MEPKPMHPSYLLRAFQRHKELNLKHHPGWVDLITTKQNKTNKLPSFINRFAGFITQESFSFNHELVKVRLLFQMHVTNMSRTFVNLVFVFESMSPTCQELFKFGFCI
jgi:hypothetical protein